MKRNISKYSVSSKNQDETELQDYRVNYENLQKRLIKIDLMLELREKKNFQSPTETNFYPNKFTKKPEVVPSTKIFSNKIRSPSHSNLNKIKFEPQQILHGPSNINIFYNNTNFNEKKKTNKNSIDYSPKKKREIINSSSSSLSEDLDLDEITESIVNLKTRINNNKIEIIERENNLNDCLNKCEQLSKKSSKLIHDYIISSENLKSSESKSKRTSNNNIINIKQEILINNRKKEEEDETVEFEVSEITEQDLMPHRQNRSNRNSIDNYYFPNKSCERASSIKSELKGVKEILSSDRKLNQIEPNELEAIRNGNFGTPFSNISESIVKNDNNMQTGEFNNISFEDKQESFNEKNSQNLEDEDDPFLKLQELIKEVEDEETDNILPQKSEVEFVSSSIAKMVQKKEEHLSRKGNSRNAQNKQNQKILLSGHLINLKDSKNNTPITQDNLTDKNSIFGLGTNTVSKGFL